MKYFSSGCLIFFAMLLSCDAPRYADALEPQEAVKSFQLRKGFRIELFASEPDVVDPVEMIFDEAGNAYVVEMPDYPYKPEAGTGAGKIKVLRDTNFDGRVDQAILFADSLSEATSMLRWKDGLIVTTAPHIIFLRDTNADFVADTKEILFSGFFANNSEAQITSLRQGIDNWIYAANNGQPGEVASNRNPEAAALSMGGFDFRFRLDRNQFERETGTAQFGHTLDDWGNRFVTQNTLHIRQVVIPYRYLHRHHNLPANSSMINISDHDLEMFQVTPAPYWRAERTRRRQIQYAEQKLDRVEYAEDHFTGSSGGTIYDGDAFPGEYYGNVFTGDVAGNLIHRDILNIQKDQPVMLAQRDAGELNCEFLTSSDPWFRPTGFTVGPDGFLYVIDMYRQHIETPLSIPEDLKADMDFLRGSDRGRIYRIVPESTVSSTGSGTAPGGFSSIANDSSGDLVKLLAHPNRWKRMQAQRILLERHDGSVIPSVVNLLSEHADARTRLHALYVLEGLDVLDVSLVSKAMTDSHPAVRKHGLILAERYPALLPQVLESMHDTSTQVAFQATLSAGQFSGKKVEDALAEILVERGSDPWFRTAALSAEAGSSLAVLEKLITQHAILESAEPWRIAILHDICHSIGSADRPEEVVALIRILSTSLHGKDEKIQLAAVNGLKAGLQKTPGRKEATRDALNIIQSDNAAEIPNALREIESLYRSQRSL